MSKNTKIQTVIENMATSMKVAGALMLGVAIAPITAFGALLAGCSISVGRLSDPGSLFKQGQCYEAAS